jgi:uncharacterized protein with HEPN domain
MFNGKDKLILEFVLQMIDEAEKVIERYGSAYLALNDFEGKNAILLNLLQIGEKLNKIESQEIRELLPISEAYSIRNRITHDYDGIDLEIVEYILNKEFPLLKQKIVYLK